MEEGDDFRLVVRKKYKSHAPHETIRVFWYTEAITADEADYEHMDGVRQASNEYQSRTGKMGGTSIPRTTYTPSPMRPIRSGSITRMTMATTVTAQSS